MLSGAIPGNLTHWPGGVGCDRLSRTAISFRKVSKGSGLRSQRVGTRSGGEAGRHLQSERRG
eukprot:2372110-Prymnesium_polylepis.1